tara:strand:+ start:179 stop:547 length:369 start_codon:yes stop_codon:yes gene_type:complete
MQYVTITGQENKIDQDIIITKHVKTKFCSLLLINIIHFVLTTIIAIFFAIVIYNLVIFRDNVDIQKQITKIDYVTVKVSDFLDKNQYFLNNASHFMDIIEGKLDTISKIMNNVCKLDPSLCQ